MKPYRPPSAVKAAQRPVAQSAPRPRRRRWLRRLVITVVVLAVALFAGFWWLAYYPFEGKADSVSALVPADVDFMYRTSWAELKAGGWIKRNVLDDPIHPALDPKKIPAGDVVGGPQTLADRLETYLPEQEAQINDSIPAAAKVLEGIVFGTKEFRVEKDLLRGEVVAAGRWCGGGSPQDGPPKWREILLLTRVSPLVKFAFEAARHDFIRERALARPDLAVTATGDGLLRVEMTQAPVPRTRQTCEGGFEMGPMNVWYVARVKDVLAITNSEDLALKVKSIAAGGGERAIDRPSFDVERREGTIVASLDVTGIRSYLVRALASDQPATPTAALSALLGKFIAIDALDRASATIDLKDDGLAAVADVKFNNTRLGDFRDVAATYELEPAPVADGVLRLIPEEDTVMVALLRTPPRAALGVLYDNFSKDTQKAIASQVRDMAAKRRAADKEAYDDVSQFLDDLAKQLGTTTAIAVARIPSVYDKATYAEWYLNNDPVPQSALALIVKIKDGARQEQVDEYLADRVSVLGFEAPTRAKSPAGVEYSRMKMPTVPADYDQSKPAFIVHEGYLILATREDYLLRILALMRGGTDAPKSIAATPEFRSAMGSLPSAATVGVYVNGDAMRKLAWDYRNVVVRGSHDEAQHEKAFRAQRIAEIGRLNPGKPINFDADFQKRLKDDVNAEMERFRTEGYTKFIAEYKADLDATRRISALGLVLAAHRPDSTIDLGVRLVLVPGTGP